MKSILFRVAAIVATSALCIPAFAANPSSGTLSFSESAGPSATLTYNTGPMPVANASGAQVDEYDCDELNPCDDYTLTVTVPADFRSTHPAWRVRIVTAAIPEATDIDLRITDAEGNVVAVVRDNPPAQPSYVFQPKNGTEIFHVQIVPGTPIPDATASITLFEDPAFLGGEPAVTQLGGPTFGIYPRPNISPYSASEPTMGVNVGTQSAYYLNNYDVLKAEWDTDNNVRWTNIGNGGALTTADPFMTVDQFQFDDGDPATAANRFDGPANPRVWIAQLLAASSYIAFSDDDGATWTNSITGPGQVHGVDNQSIAAGPYPDTGKPVTAAAGTYEHALYYCSHEAVNAFCSRSDDGGLTFGPSRPIFPIDSGCNNHGHVKVGYDGTVFVPMNNSCLGTEGVTLSVDGGETWHYIGVPGTRQGRWDSSIAMSRDGKTVWYGYAEEGDDRAMMVRGTLDKTNPNAPTINWQLPATDVGAPAGLKNIVFSTVVAGDPGRAAMAFHGTTKAGDSGQISSAQGATWYTYIATTFDNGKTWNLRDINPGDPVQRNDICDQGTTCVNTGNHRNLLDFMDMDIDGEGRLVLIYADGCTGGCVAEGGAANYSALGVFARQITGQRMFAAFDPVATPQPGIPSVSGNRNQNGVTLSWAAVNPGTGGTLTRYGVERSVNGSVFTELAQPTTPGYADTAAVDPDATYAYRVRAFNSGGFSSDYSDVVTLAPAGEEESACTLPGVTVATDATGDQAETSTEQGDIEYIAVAEPYVSDSDKSVTFTIKVPQLEEPLQPNTAWKVRFSVKDDAGADRQLYVEMSTKDTTYPAVGPDFGYGWTDGTTDTGQGGSIVTGSFDADGNITIKMDISQPIGFRSLAGSTDVFKVTLKPGSVLGSISGVTQLLIGAQPGGSGGGLLQEVDATNAGSNYTLQGNIACSPNDVPTAQLTKTREYNAVPGQSLTVDFDATASSDSDGTVVEYLFSYGDGQATSNSTGLTSHEYSGQGGESFGATVRVRDDKGALSSPSTMVQIVIPEDQGGGGGGTDMEITASLGASPQGGNVPLIVDFDASASAYTADGKPLEEPEYTFVFGNGEYSEAQSSPTIQYTYVAAGEYKARVIVVDKYGNVASSDPVDIVATITITVTPGNGTVAQLTVDRTSGPAPLTVNFDGSRSIAADGTTIESYTFDFGDGSPVQTGSSPTARHVYTQPGTYQPTLTINDDQGGTSTAKAQVGVSGGGNPPPAPVAGSGGGGGSLGWMLLAPMALLGLRRRWLAR